MDSYLKELIQMATATGTISSEHEHLIIEKAQSQGISEIEVRLYINTALQGNRRIKDDQSSITKAVDIKEFAYTEWLIVLGIIVVAISGFFPWVTAKAYSSGFGQRFSGGASSSVGFVYSVPLAISALIVLFNRKFQKYLLYEGLGLIVVALGLMVNYSTKTSGSYGGVSAGVSSSAGPGVIILLIGGVIYTIGTLLRDVIKKKNVALINIIRHPLTVFILLELSILLPGLLRWNLRQRNTELFLIGLIFAFAPFFVSKKIKYERFNSVATSTLFVWVVSLFIPRYSENNILYNLIDAFGVIVPWYFILAMLLGSIALLADYQENSDKELQFVQKLKNLFSAKLLIGIFIGVLLLFFGYNVTTKHKVTYAEMNAFNERNGKIKGDWYFLNDDSTALFKMRINLATSSASDNGDIPFSYTANLSNDNLSIEGINFQEYNGTSAYSDSISFPILFNNGLKIMSAEVDKINGSFNLNGKTINFEGYRDKAYVYNIIQSRNIRIASEELSKSDDLLAINEDDIANMSPSQSFMIYDPDGYTNLRDTPDGNIIRRVTGDERFHIIGMSGDYFEVKMADGMQGYLYKNRVQSANNP
jgi:hypothetical protein